MNTRAHSFLPQSAFRKRLATALASCLIALLFSSATMAQDPGENLTAEDVQQRIDTAEEPMYTPFVELYLLEETKALRKEMMNTRAELIEKVVDKELSVADKTMSYATDTVTYFFYLIAGATSILVVIGWNSIRDMRNQLTSLAEKRVNELVVEYERRLEFIEDQLKQKSDIIHQNQAEIERLIARAVAGAHAATEATSRRRILDYVTSFAGWNDEQKRSFRAGQQAFRAGRQALRDGDAAEALRLGQECLELAEPLGDWWGTAMGYGLVGSAHAASGQPEAAATAMARAALTTGAPDATNRLVALVEALAQKDPK